MGLIGTLLESGSPHPQAFIDPLYEEIFDHHDEEVEVDVFVAMKTIEGDDDMIHVSEVIDFTVSRVDRELLLDDYDDLDNFRQGVEWALGVIDSGAADHFVFIHKHGPNFPTPGDKDFLTNDILAAIDFSYDRELRMFSLMAVVNRDASTPMSPSSRIKPIGLIEVDGLTSYRMGKAALEDPEVTDRDPEDVEVFTALIERQREMAGLAREARLAGDYDLIEGMAPEFHASLLEAGRIALIWAPPRVIPPELKELLDTLMRIGQGLNMDVDGEVELPPLGFDVPQIEMLPPLTPSVGEPGEARPQPGSIFDLPDLDPSKPDPEIRWDN